MSLLPADTQLTILASQKLGHANQCEGIARALGLSADIRPVRPRFPFKLIAPWGPPDPLDTGKSPSAALRLPYPDIALASGRETVPYLRALKRLSGGRTFCVYLGDPRVSHARFDLIALPEHDRYRAKNVLATLTSPHPRDKSAREAAAVNPDPRVIALPEPRVALFLGGPNATYKYTRSDILALADIARTILNSGSSLMATSSRRTPKELVDTIRSLVPEGSGRSFFWNGEGNNPYMSMLAHSDAFIVTADSMSMIAECISTGKPVALYEPAGHPGKFAHLIDALRSRGVIRPWAGHLESWTYDPVDSTPHIAAEITRLYLASRQTPPAI